MKTWIVAVSMTCASAGTWACQQSPPAAPTAASPAPASGQSAPAAQAAASANSGSSDPSAPAAPPALQQAARVDVCSLLSAAEVSAIMGKPLVQSPHSCEYGLDPSAKEKAMADVGVKQGAGDAKNMTAMMQAFAKGGRGKAATTASTMMDQLTISINATQDGTTEAEAKKIYTQVGGTVNQALHPEAHNANEVIQVGDEIRGVGDWAFATNAASVNVMGLSIRGRLLEIGKAPWHVTVGATVSPDPGVAVLDKQLADVARALIAKL